MTYSLTRFAIYETVRDHVTKGSEGPLPFYKKVLLGSISGEQPGGQRRGRWGGGPCQWSHVGCCDRLYRRLRGDPRGHGQRQVSAVPEAGVLLSPGGAGLTRWGLSVFCLEQATQTSGSGTLGDGAEPVAGQPWAGPAAHCQREPLPPAGVCGASGPAAP